MTRTASSTFSTYAQTGIAFIDRGVEDYQRLVSGTQERIRVVLLDRHRCGIEQIAEVLAKDSYFQDIHIISHGAPGCLQLGNTQLSLDTLDRYATPLKTAFSGASNLLLYGCNVAAGDAGEEFIAKLHHLTGIEIAASARRTGNAALDADWNLEVTTANFTGNLAFTPEAMATYPFAFPTPITGITASYQNLPVNTGSDYTQQELNSPNDTYDHKFQVGNNNNLIISGFSTTATSYSFDGLVDRINIERRDHNNVDPVTGERQVIWFEYDNIDTSGTNPVLNIRPETVATMEDVLLSNVINRGTDNIFGNENNTEGNNNNIERVDFISDTGVSAPASALDDIGFLLLERGGNDRVRIAAITQLDPVTGKPSAFGPRVRIQRNSDLSGGITHWGKDFSRTIDAAITRQNPGEANLQLTDTSEGQRIAGTFVTYNELGVSGNQIFYGYALFPDDLQSDLVDLTDARTDTRSNATTQGGLDLIGGGGVYIVNGATLPPVIDLDQNDSSTATGNDHTRSFTPGAGAVNIADTDVKIVDNDDTQLNSATITLVSPPDGGSETLSLTGSFGGITITGSGSGTITLSGPTSITDYQAAIAAIEYNNSSTSPTTTTNRTINVTVSDGTNTSNTAVSTIAYTPNTAPTASDNTISTNEDISHTFTEGDFGFADTDNGDTLQAVKITSLPSNGTLQLDGVAVTQDQVIPAADIGKLTFVPNSNESGAADFNFQVSDGISFSQNSTITLNVASINDEPTFSGLDNNPNFTPEGAPVVLDGNATVSDPELNADNYNGATLTLQRNGGENEEDIFGNSGNLGSLTEGENLVVGGTTIGTVTKNSDGTLELSFNDSATQTLVNQVLQQITYSNSNATPPSSVQINYTFNDGNTGDLQGSGGAKDGTGSITVNIEPDPAPEPDPDPTPEPDPDPTPEPDRAPNPDPDPAPEPDLTPNPDPDPASEPDPTPEPNPAPAPVPEVAQTHDDDDCCCPTPPTFDGVFVQPIPDFTPQQLPNIANTLTGSNNDDSLLGTVNNDAILGLARDDRADGSDGDDVLTGGLSSPIPVGSDLDRDTLYGNRGNDVILGNEGNDRIHGGQDRDVVFAGKDNDLVKGELGEDTLLGEQGEDTLIGGSDDATIVDTAADLIYGGAGNDALYGNQGQDSISGGDGNDIAFGGQDGDLLSGDAGNDTLEGEQGNDTILGSLGSANGVGATGDRDWLSGNQGDDLIKGGQGKDTVYAGQNSDIVYGGKDDDLIFGDKGTDTLRGDLGNDTIAGGTSTFNDAEGVSDGDVIFGGAGDDAIDGNLGNDNLVGGTGNDTIHGGQHDDLIWGETGNDLLFGDLGNDSVCGGDGDDTLIGSNGNPANTADGDDKLCGGAGDDMVFGNEGDDKLTGNAGDDRLYGGRGNDTITGGSGSDILSAEQGNDVLTGDAGGDRFDFGANHGTNIITDFTDGEDIIGLQDGITFAQLSIAQVGNNTQITTGALSVTLQGVNVSAIGSDDFALV